MPAIAKSAVMKSITRVATLVGFGGGASLAGARAGAGV